MKQVKILGYSIHKTKDIEPVIKKNKELENTNTLLEKRLHEMHNELRICKQLLDASQDSITQLNKR